MVKRKDINIENFGNIVNDIFKKTSPELALYFSITLVFYLNGVTLQPVYGGFITIIITAAFRWAKVKIDGLLEDNDKLQKQLHDIKYDNTNLVDKKNNEVVKENNRTPIEHIQDAVADITKHFPMINEKDLPIDKEGEPIIPFTEPDNIKENGERT